MMYDLPLTAEVHHLDEDVVLTIPIQYVTGYHRLAAIAAAGVIA